MSSLPGTDLVRRHNPNNRARLHEVEDHEELSSSNNVAIIVDISMCLFFKGKVFLFSLSKFGSLLLLTRTSRRDVKDERERRPFLQLKFSNRTKLKEKGIWFYLIDKSNF